MRNPSANTLSLASLFTLVTLFAVVVWGVIYAPPAMYLIATAAIPAVVRMRTWWNLAARTGRTFTVTEITIAYVGAIVVGGVALAAVGQTFLLTLNPYLPVQEHDQTVENMLWLATHLAALGACEFFLIGELWLFPQRFVDAHERLPTHAELAAQLLKAVSSAAFVLGACTWALLAMKLSLPPAFVESELVRKFAAAGLMLLQTLTFVAAYRFVSDRFGDAFTRGVAGCFLLVAIYFVNPESHSSGQTWWAPFVPLPVIWCVFALLIWAPGLKWPPLLATKVKSRGRDLPQVIAIPDFDRRGTP